MGAYSSKTTYMNDLVIVTSQVLSNIAKDIHSTVVIAFNNTKNITELNTLALHFLDLLKDFDILLGTST
jgi:hypothetical protein